VGVAADGPGPSGEMIRIQPDRVLAWGIDSDAFAAPLARDVERPVGSD